MNFRYLMLATGELDVALVALHDPRIQGKQRLFCCPKIKAIRMPKRTHALKHRNRFNKDDAYHIFNFEHRCCRINNDIMCVFLEHFFPIH